MRQRKISKNSGVLTPKSKRKIKIISNRCLQGKIKAQKNLKGGNRPRMSTEINQKRPGVIVKNDKN